MSVGGGFGTGVAAAMIVLLGLWVSCDVPVRPGTLETRTRGEVACDELRIINGNGVTGDGWICTVPLGELRIPLDSVRAVRWPTP